MLANKQEVQMSVTFQSLSTRIAAFAAAVILSSAMVSVMAHAAIGTI
jgi:hypothetical protein